MKFYEFKNSEYYALIISNNLENSLIGYQEVICNIELTKGLIKELRLDNMYNDRGLYRLKQEVNNE